MTFYATFAALYPYHDALHLGGAVASSEFVAALPAGLAGLVGMVRNWLFTLFYCASELWGDVVLSLLFWGLANETTSIEDAPLLYPLFGVGANLAQTMAGESLPGCLGAPTHRVSRAEPRLLSLGRAPQAASCACAVTWASARTTTRCSCRASWGSASCWA